MGGKVTLANDHIYDFPVAYDGTKPFPLLMGFHAAGNPIDQIEGLTNNSEFATTYVRAFPKSAGSAWDYNTDLSSKVYKAYDDLMANYCIDTGRVFATGHSSGAQLIVQILPPPVMPRSVSASEPSRRSRRRTTPALTRDESFQSRCVDIDHRILSPL